MDNVKVLFTMLLILLLIRTAHVYLLNFLYHNLVVVLATSGCAVNAVVKKKRNSNKVMFFINSFFLIVRFCGNLLNAVPMGLKKQSIRSCYRYAVPKGTKKAR